MTPAFTFDIDSLLAPISADRPTGENLRYEGTYDRIREARREDDMLEQGIWQANRKRADWPAVEEICLSAIETRSKDLQIAAWLLEAWIHLHGFGGMAAGLQVCLALAETWWDGLHPQIEDGDADFRLAPIHWLNEKLPADIGLIPITSPNTDSVPAYCWADWEKAIRHESLPKPAGAKTSNGPTQADFQQGLLLTPTEFFIGLERDLRLSLDTCARFEHFLDGQFERGAPSLIRFRTAAERIYGLIDNVLNQRDTSPRRDAGDPPERVDSELPEPAAGAAPFVRIRSRADAYRVLSDAADYLVRTEPHSPAPYLVKRAIAWGGMRLEDLLPELVRNDTELTEIFRLLQIGVPQKNLAPKK